MKPTSFEYERPDSLDAAMRLLGDNPGAKLIAGGQSLGPLLNLRLATPSLLIDISRLEELREHAAHDGYVVLGAGVRHAEFEDGRVPAVLNGLFERAARQIAYRAVRNRGTIGGSLAHAGPAADWPAIMIALAAEVEARSVRGSRRIPAADLPNQVLETCLEVDEIITSVRVARCGEGARVGYYRLSAQPGDFAEALAVIVHDPQRGYTQAVLSGARQPPQRLGQTARAVAAHCSGNGKADLPAAVEADLTAISGTHNLTSYEWKVRRASVLRAAQEVCV
jgi:aerobic carbon-monoxide dehydrogenase medium subunit